MSSSPHSTIIPSDFDIENTFSSTNILNYFSASSGSISPDSSNDFTKYLLDILVFLTLHDDSKIEIIQAYDTIPPPQVVIALPAILPPSLVLFLLPMFDSQDLFPSKKISPRDTQTPVESPIFVSPSSSEGSSSPVRPTSLDYLFDESIFWIQPDSISDELVIAKMAKVCRFYTPVVNAKTRINDIPKVQDIIINDVNTTNEAKPSPSAKINHDTPAPQDKWSRDQHILLVNILGEPRVGVTIRSKVRDSEATSTHECLYIFKNKMDENGVVIRNKARLVAQGYRQEEGIDYNETFSQVARLKSIRIFLAYATYICFMMYQIDMKSAFLNGRLSEEVYVQQLHWFESSQLPDYRCKLDKALYGLKQPPIVCTRSDQSGQFESSLTPHDNLPSLTFWESKKMVDKRGRWKNQHLGRVDDEEGLDPLEFITWRNSKIKDHIKVDETTKCALLYSWIEVGNNEGLIDEDISSDDDGDQTNLSMLTKPEIKIDDLGHGTDYFEFICWLASKFDNHWELDKNVKNGLWEFNVNGRTKRTIDDLVNESYNESNKKTCSDSFFKPYFDAQDGKDIYEIIDRDYSLITIPAHRDISNHDELCQTKEFAIIRYLIGSS
uniref:Retrovirus-related Pol polyprotein from transposon TNT 1-94 n=1 Tax=Tanacetum cinerariifolium TaxID=118510 RepID=A0A6L2JGQ8_TANCI|nr:retrovirus-related Pol polyprotein from transposon TNT 1-94 [Tanacetum cinerariifolium]